MSSYDDIRALVKAEEAMYREFLESVMEMARSIPPPPKHRSFCPTCTEIDRERLTPCSNAWHVEHLKGDA